MPKLRFMKRKVHNKPPEQDDSQDPKSAWSYSGYYEKESESAPAKPYQVVVMKIAKEKLARFPVEKPEEDEPQSHNGVQLGDEIEDDDHQETHAPPDLDLRELNPEAFREFLLENPDGFLAWQKFVNSRRQNNTAATTSEQLRQVRAPANRSTGIRLEAAKSAESREGNMEYRSLYSLSHRHNSSYQNRSSHIHRPINPNKSNDPNIAAIGKALREVRPPSPAEAMETDGDATNTEDQSTNCDQNLPPTTKDTEDTAAHDKVEMSVWGRGEVRLRAASLLEKYNNLKEKRQGSAEARKHYDQIFKGIDKTLAGWYGAGRITYYGELWAPVTNIRELNLKEYHHTAKGILQREELKEEEAFQELVDEAREIHKWMMEEGQRDLQ